MRLIVISYQQNILARFKSKSVVAPAANVQQDRQRENLSGFVGHITAADLKHVNFPENQGWIDSLLGLCWVYTSLNLFTLKL